ncbi:hypothetical protein NDU88_004917 [Pleurodeles waltl]|uniref:Uncharacterized protein n=1 Tax=Pleurodeles waltl TaxID=8319 RepID=A0AAV7PEG2_PLEWA|nr:hypothetical protein NDU88_004917 [Pleurodeles waltl]
MACSPLNGKVQHTDNQVRGAQQTLLPLLAGRPSWTERPSRVATVATKPKRGKAARGGSEAQVELPDYVDEDLEDGELRETAEDEAALWLMPNDLRNRRQEVVDDASASVFQAM